MLSRLTCTHHSTCTIGELAVKYAHINLYHMRYINLHLYVQVYVHLQANTNVNLNVHSL